MAKKLEEHLYRSAHTKDEYVDPASLKRRLHLIAKGVGIPKPDEGEDLEGVGGDISLDGGDLNVSNHSNNQAAVPLEAPSQGPGNDLLGVGASSANNSNNPLQQQANGSIAQDQTQQMLMLQQQQQQLLMGQGQAQGSESANEQSNDGLNIPGLNPQDLTNDDSGNGNPRSEKKKVILLQQQRRLLLLRHASKCEGGANCRTKFCPQMVTLWKHMKKCRDKHCKVSHCLSSRCVLNHYRICKSEGKTASCAICAPVMKHIRNNGDANSVGTPGGGSEGGVDDLDTLALGSDGLDPLASLDDAGIGAGMEPDGGSAGGAQGLANFEPLDAFTMSERHDGSNSLSPKPAIPAAIGTPSEAPQDPQQQSTTESLSAAIEGIQSQSAQGQQQQQNGNANAQDLQQGLQKKHLLLQQVQQQKVRKMFTNHACMLILLVLTNSSFLSHSQANLFGQSQKLQKQLMAASNPQQAQQLQKQQTILQQLNHQFEQQQSILQSEIQRQTMLLQQTQQNNQQQPAQGAGPLQQNNLAGDDSKPSAVTPNQNGASTASTSSNLKRSPEQGSDDLRPNKLAKTGDNEDVAKSASSAEASANGVAAMANSSGGVPKKASPDGASTDKASSLIETMPPSAIEQHLDSLANKGQVTPRQLARTCLPLVRKLIDHDHGWVFKDAVDPVELGIPDYFEVVKHPMDLTLVVKKLQEGTYKDLASFERDTKLVFENAILFNGEDSDVGGMAQELLDIFAADLKNAMKGEVRTLINIPKLLCTAPLPVFSDSCVFSTSPQA